MRPSSAEVPSAIKRPMFGVEVFRLYPKRKPSKEKMMTTGWGSLERERALTEEREKEGDIRWKARKMEREETIMREKSVRDLVFLRGDDKEGGLEMREVVGVSSWSVSS